MRNRYFLATLTLCTCLGLLGFLQEDAQNPKFEEYRNGPRERIDQRFTRSFEIDDGTAEIHTGSESEYLVVANRFLSGRPVSLAHVSFYTSGAAAGDPAEVIVYEDATGTASEPDASLEVFRSEITLGRGGFQEVDVGGLMLNAAGNPEAAFFVGIANAGPRSFSLGIDMTGPRGRASFLSEDGGDAFVSLSSMPIIHGNAMIRVFEERRFFFRRGVVDPSRLPARAADVHEIDASLGLGRDLSDTDTIRIGGSSDECAGGDARGSRQACDTLINDLIHASSSSSSCPGCSPALTPGYPSFTVGTPDRYVDYVTIENSSATPISMPIRATVTSLTSGSAPETIYAFNPDGGGGQPPTTYWEYSLATSDGTDSADDVLDPGETIARLWEIADETGLAFSFWADAYTGCLDFDTGTGDDGAVVFSTETNINIDNTIAGRACADGGDAVSYSATALTGTTATLSETPSAGCLEVNDEILLINLLGTSGASDNTGNNETVRIAGIAGNVITFMQLKTKYYGAGGSDDSGIGTGAGEQKVMIQRVPNYTNVTVSVGAMLTASGFDGTRGGVLFFKATGSVVVNGTIDADGKGLRGGAAGVGGPEGYAGRSAIGGGGGGGGSGGHQGSSTCAYGGAGADGAEDGYCGDGYGDHYDPCPGYDNMCTANGCGGDGVSGGGGGGAGYGWDNGPGGLGADGGGDGGDKINNVGYSGSNGAAGCGGGAGGAGRDSAGGGGGGKSYDSETNASTIDLAKMRLGGGAAAGGGGGGGGGSGDFQCAGGGAGGSKTGAGGARGTDTCGAADSTAGSDGTQGGTGGGIVAITAEAVTVSGAITAAGGPGGDGGAGGRGAGSCGSAGAGGGGGAGANGASGGSILIRAQNASVGVNLTTALGGSGGSGASGGLSNGGSGGASSGNGGSGGAGSAGSHGVIAIYATSLSGSTDPSAYTE